MTMTTTIYKKNLRREIKSRLATLSADEKLILSHAVIEKFLAHPAYKNSQIIMAYFSTAEEIQLQEFFSAAFNDGKILAVPFIEGREMYAAILPDIDAAEVGAYGILTVKSSVRKIIDAEKINCIVTPGLAFDANFNRLGKGGGFYDKFLSRAVNAVKIALAYDNQIVENVPIEPHDVKVDFVLTPTKNFSCA
ncbi:MAG: 5-formyltetrahydrofolate cyclo-ligase [Selenomonadaceae bacterium]|nr:5-formyltetrahydrofolate cyclo-ligase [Selenomonadaceae bacterium]